jgi:hypothetical protein
MWRDGPIIRCEGIFRPGTIMNRAFHIGIVLAVAAHMVCGCCLHHAHGSTSQSDDPVSVDSICPCEHHGHQHEGQPSDHRSGDQECDGSKCVFTLPGSGNSSPVTIGGDFLPFIYVEPILPGMNGIDSVDTVPHHCGPPIPLHLLNQVLLI